MSDPKGSPELPPYDTEAGGYGYPTDKKAKWASTFGGDAVWVGPRIAPVADHLKENLPDTQGLTAEEILEQQINADEGADIQYRTCSWQKTAGLLFSEYICLAIMSFPWSYSYLGLVPGIIITIVIAASVLYTSLVLWEFCLRHPEVRDVCDLGQTLFWGSKWAWYATAVMFILNNTFIQALHVLVGAEYLNTMTAADDIGGCRTVQFGVVVSVICFFASLPRTFDMLSKLGTASALFTFVGVTLATIFAGIQDHPAGYKANMPIKYFVGTPGTTTFLTGMSAFLNITYTFVGQITIPSFIAEMKNPRDFPKSLWACTIAEIIVFSVVGSVMYVFSGNQYVTAPAFGLLENLYKKVSFSFMIPTLIFLGCLYASVTARFIFFRIFRNSRHLNSHTLVGWGTWAGILAVTWILAFIISQVIPFFNSLLAVMSSLFDCWFGFIFWGVAYFRMRSVDRTVGRKRNPIGDALGIALNIVIILIGFYMLGPGTYVSVKGIVDAYAAGQVGSVFSCASNGI